MSDTTRRRRFGRVALLCACPVYLVLIVDPYVPEPWRWPLTWSALTAGVLAAVFGLLSVPRPAAPPEGDHR